MKLNVIKMKSSRIICCCKATLQGLRVGDTAVLGNGRADMGVQQPVTPFLPGGVHLQRSPLRVTAMMMSSKWALA